MTKHQVFISYAKEDKENARKICEYLEERSIDCWVSYRNIPHGSESFEEEIVDAIDMAKLVLVVFTSNSNNSKWVKAEVKLAWDMDKVIIPLRLENIEPGKFLSLYLGSKQLFEAHSEPLENCLPRLVGDVEKIANPETDKSNIFVFGGKGSGKTVLLSLIIDNVISSDYYGGNRVLIESGVDLYSKNINALKQSTHLSSTIRGRINSYILRIIDMVESNLDKKIHFQDISGDDLYSFYNRVSDEGTQQPRINSNIKRDLNDANAMIITIEPCLVPENQADVKKGNRYDEFIFDLKMLLNFLRYFKDVRKSQSIDIPIAIVLTKNELYKITSPRDFMQKVDADTLNQIDEILTNYQIFTSQIDVERKEDRTIVPKRPLRYHGVSEIVEWLKARI